MVDGKKKENRLEGCSSLGRMKIGRDTIRDLKSYKNFTKPSRVWWDNSLLVLLQNLRFSRKVGLVVSFPKS
jgi:hypothetical protein